MNKTMAITVIALVALVMGISSVAPVLALPISINPGVLDSGVIPQVDSEHCDPTNSIAKSIGESVEACL